MSQQLKRMEDLVNILNIARFEFEQKNESNLTNKQYDTYYDELVLLENLLGRKLPNSPTQSVGFEVVSNLEKVKHPSKMLSLDKTKEISKLKEFLKDQTGLLSWKLDGLTVVLTYEDGKLLQAVTRGNGEIGEDVTHNAKHFKNIPLRINYKSKLVLRGEAVISYETFEEINSKLPPDKQYENPRNLASGTVRQLNSEICKERNVEWICFDVIEGLEDILLKSSWFDKLDSLGFETVENKEIYNTIDFEKVFNSFDPKGYKYPVDGLVLTYNSVKFSKYCPITSHHPTHSLAFKWEDETYETTLIDIEWNVGRTGTITPVAIFEPVYIDGSTVERASLHNLDIMEDLELGIGDTVTVYKANQIIPQIDDNLTRSNSVKIPQNCPSCGQKTTIFRQNSAKLVCENPNCQQKLLAKFEHFVKRDCMNIVGLSSETLELFINNGWIEEFSDLYDTSLFATGLKQEEGWGVKSISKLIDSINKSRNCTLAQFITSLGIEGVGRSQGKILANHFKDIKHYTGASYEELIKLDGIGKVTAKAILDYWSNNYEQVELLIKQLNIQPIEEVATKSTNSISGKTFVITGSINHYKNRNELQAEIESLGGKVASSVSKSTDYLINNDLESTSGKNAKAKTLGVPIISEEDYINLKIIK